MTHQIAVKGPTALAVSLAPCAKETEQAEMTCSSSQAGRQAGRGEGGSSQVTVMYPTGGSSQVTVLYPTGGGVGVSHVVGES